jgi:hypothetical protein
MSTFVNVDNYAWAEVASQGDRLVRMMGCEVNGWVHIRQPTPLDKQTVIRMNRDTLYSLGIADISEGATLTIPDAAGRYMTVMVINEEGYVNRVFHDAGEHQLTAEEFGSSFVILAGRTLADPVNADDLAIANRLQDGLLTTAPSKRPWPTGQYDDASYEATKKALLELGEGMHESERMFGPKERVDPVRFLIGAAAGFGGLPEEEAYYALKVDSQSVGRYRLTVKDAPVDAFWSVSIYNKDGYFEENQYNSYSVNSVTAKPNSDGSVTVDFGPEPDGSDNFLYIMDGWNYAARMYRPRPSILDGTWTFPEPEAIRD